MVRTAVVTGGAMGIGAATARALAEDGIRVAIWDRDGAAAEATAAALRGVGGEACARQLDVRDSAAVQRAVAELMERWGRLEILVNNAGIARTGSLLDSTEELWDETIAINLKAVWICSKYAVPAMRAGGGGGTIVNIGSTASLVGFANLSAYCASKGGVAQLTRALAVELAPEIRVNCVCPGHTETPMGNGFVAAQADPEAFFREFVRTHPLGRQAQPGEIAAAIRFLVSPGAAFMTGAVIPVDAGYSAK